MFSRAINLQYCTETQMKSLEGLDASKVRRLIKIRKETGEITLKNLVEESKMDEAHWQNLIEQKKITLEDVITKEVMEEHVTEEIKQSMTYFEKKMKQVITKTVTEQIDKRLTKFTEDNQKFIETTVNNSSAEITKRLDIIVLDLQGIKTEHQKHEYRFTEIEEKIAEVSQAYDSAHTTLMQKVDENSKEIADLTAQVNTGFLTVNQRIQVVEDKLNPEKTDFLDEKLEMEQASVQGTGADKSEQIDPAVEEPDFLDDKLKMEQASVQGTGADKSEQIDPAVQKQLLQQQKLLKVASKFESVGLPTSTQNEVSQGAIPKKQGGKEDKIETELQQGKGKIMKSQATSTPLLKSKDTSDSTGYEMPE